MRNGTHLLSLADMPPSMRKSIAAVFQDKDKNKIEKKTETFNPANVEKLKNFVNSNSSGVCFSEDIYA